MRLYEGFHPALGIKDRWTLSIKSIFGPQIEHVVYSCFQTSSLCWLIWFVLGVVKFWLILEASSPCLKKFVTQNWQQWYLEDSLCFLLIWNSALFVINWYINSCSNIWLLHQKISCLSLFWHKVWIVLWI